MIYLHPLPGKWSFSASADITRYDAKSFERSLYVPLLRAEINRYFMKGNRAVITLSAFDILNKNTGIQRISELNYLQEKQSNTIQRYLMLSLKYRFNKYESKGKGGMDIKIRNR